MQVIFDRNFKRLNVSIPAEPWTHDRGFLPQYVLNVPICSLCCWQVSIYIDRYLPPYLALVASCFKPSRLSSIYSMCPECRCCRSTNRVKWLGETWQHLHRFWSLIRRLTATRAFSLPNREFTYSSLVERNAPLCDDRHGHGSSASTSSQRGHDSSATEANS